MSKKLSRTDADYTVGVINPSTGVYRDVRRFTVGTGTTVIALGSDAVWASNVVERGEKMWPLSPDGNRLAAMRSIGNQPHAGWIDTEGRFTDMTSGQTMGAFEGYVSFEAIGFDAAGRYYYLKNLGSAKKLEAYVVDTAGGASRLLGSLNPTAVIARLTINRQSGAVTNQDSPDCSFYSRLGTGILKAEQTQITYVASGSCHDTGIRILPGANTNPIMNPVGNTAANAVAFKLRNEGGGPVYGAIDLYTVPLTGNATPQLVRITGAAVSDYELIAWN
ncbi:hypothetical protein ACFWFQ_00735 [Nocardia salmonicida]|uniref:hypothetical protein n=1 Tax=Nocardia salmonicida TaxID=53431 RepID=UPI0036566572